MPYNWTLAEIKAINAEHGGKFFTRKTMGFFGDTMRSFAVCKRKEGEPILIRRVRPMRDRSGRSMGGVGKLYLFNPDTGHIGSYTPPTAAEKTRACETVGK